MKEKKITTLDYIILALLFGEEQSGYRLRKSFEESALGNFGGDSPGTIYPALKRLEKNEFVLKGNVDKQMKCENWIIFKA